MIVIDLMKDIDPSQLKPGQTICPILSRVEPVEGGFGGSHVTLKSMMFVCIGSVCAMHPRCSNTPGKA